MIDSEAIYTVSMRLSAYYAVSVLWAVTIFLITGAGTAGHFGSAVLFIL